MIDRNTEERMHDVLDGVASPHELAELERAMANDPALQAKFDELSGLFAALSSVPMAEPPAALHGDLMRAIEREPKHSAAPGWMEALAAAFRARPVPAFAMTLVSAAAIGLLIYTGLDRSSLPGHATLPVTGTIAPSMDATPAGVALHAGDATVHCLAILDGRALQIEITGDAPAGARLALRFDEVTWTLAAPSGTSAAELEPGLLTLALQGRVRTEVRFTLNTAGTAPVIATLISNDEHSERTLPVIRPGENR